MKTQFAYRLWILKDGFWAETDHIFKTFKQAMYYKKNRKNVMIQKRLMR